MEGAWWGKDISRSYGREGTWTRRGLLSSFYCNSSISQLMFGRLSNTQQCMHRGRLLDKPKCDLSRCQACVCARTTDICECVSTCTTSMRGGDHPFLDRVLYQFCRVFAQSYHTTSLTFGEPSARLEACHLHVLYVG